MRAEVVILALDEFQPRCWLSWPKVYLSKRIGYTVLKNNGPFLQKCNVQSTDLMGSCLSEEP